jgi:hypothetical protein
MSGLKALQSLTDQRGQYALYPFLAGDSLELNQRCPSDGLKESFICAIPAAWSSLIVGSCRTCYSVKAFEVRRAQGLDIYSDE